MKLSAPATALALAATAGLVAAAPAAAPTPAPAANPAPQGNRLAARQVTGDNFISAESIASAAFAGQTTASPEARFLSAWPALASVAADRAQGDNAALARDLDRATADPSFTGAVLTHPVLSFFAADATAYLATASGVARVTETATVTETMTETAGCSASAVRTYA